MGVLNYPAQASPTWGDQSGRGQDLIAAIQNRAWVLATKLNHATRGEMLLGFWPSTTLGNAPNFALYTLSNELRARAAAVTTGNDAGYSAATDYPAAIVWLENAYQLYTKRSGLWYMDYQHRAAHSSNYAGFSNFSAIGTLEDKWIIQSQKADIFAPLATVETASVGAGSLNGSFAQMPPYDFFMQFVLDTIPASGRIRIAYRWIDADNYLYIDIDSGGDIILGERFEAVDFDLDTSTSPASNGDIITVINDHYRVQVFADGVQIQDFTDTNDNENQQQDWEILDLGTGGAISDLEIFRYRLQDVTGLGSDLIVNGDFDTDTDWTKGVNWTIPGGAGANHSGGNDDIEATIDPLSAGKIYRAQFTISAYVAGTLAAIVGDPGGNFYTAGFRSSNGESIGYELALVDGAFKLDSTGFQGTADDVIVQEVLFSPSTLATILDSMLGL